MTKWLPGQSGNPRGKPKQRPVSDALNMAIAEAGGAPKVLRGIMAELLALCHDEDKRIKLDSIKTLFERMEGKVQTAQELSFEGEDGRQMVIRWES